MILALAQIFKATQIWFKVVMSNYSDLNKKNQKKNRQKGRKGRNLKANQLMQTSRQNLRSHWEVQATNHWYQMKVDPNHCWRVREVQEVEEPILSNRQSREFSLRIYRTNIKNNHNSIHNWRISITRKNIIATTVFLAHPSHLILLLEIRGLH